MTTSSPTASSETIRLERQANAPRLLKGEGVRCHLHDFTVQTGAREVGVQIEEIIIEDLLDGREEIPPGSKNSAFRWLHVPVNNMAWVEPCLEKMSGGPLEDNVKEWRRKLSRPNLAGPVPPHSQFMDPSCESGIRGLRRGSAAISRKGTMPKEQDDIPISPGTKEPKSSSMKELPQRATAIQNKPIENLKRRRSTGSLGWQADEAGGDPKGWVSLFLPYPNWERYDEYVRMGAHYEMAKHYWEQYMVQGVEFLPSSSIWFRGSPLHLRRSLDQFFYTSLSDTRARDADQTVSKWTGAYAGEEGRDRAARDSLLLIVDQLWVWILDDRSMVSFFPSHEFQHRGDTARFTDVYNRVCDEWGKCRTVYDLYSLVAAMAVTSLFAPENRVFGDVLGIYRWAIGKKAARQTVLFQKFYDSTETRSTSFSSRGELKLTMEVSDILEELTILQRLMEEQEDVLRSLRLALLRLHRKKEKQQFEDTMQNGATTTVINIHGLVNSGKINFDIDTANQFAIDDDEIKGLGGVILGKTLQRLSSRKAEIEKLKEDVQGTHKQLLALLELKQAAANLAEAKTAAKQGLAIMMFTIITIVFLPLSFFTSFFGQNVSDITGDPRNPSTADLWKIGGPISAAVIVFALGFGLYLNMPDAKVWHWSIWRWRTWEWPKKFPGRGRSSSPGPGLYPSPYTHEMGVEMV
ncbi:hypothetical protein MAPG_01862 [Magnaporthiopsis poae ATCC 64411]|uniref:Uncharacterized protein n=1 Tax=Magnaporthiopsis poae (strain ATCC 64411 / 73-15) TaxID=644358 RepID=A0A0C4DPT9_MAGP6|nr:hypothetical protein MAPG_01862 [Magnaporthiopsis poae ATCC 64411]